MKLLVSTAVCCLALLHAPGDAGANQISIKHQNLTLVGNLRLAEGKSLDAGVVVLVHGTLAHMGMEIIREAQRALLERDRSSLAINLSLGIDARTGPYDCANPHRHRHRNALGEIERWISWLKGKGVTRIVLAGHSRGANQVAQLASSRPVGVEALILIAPPAWNANKIRNAFEKVDPAGFANAIKRARAAEPGKLLNFRILLYCKDVRATGETFLSYYAPDSNFDTPSLLPKTGLPTLVIAGTEDRVTPDLAARTRPYLSHKVKLSVIDDAGHFFRDLYLEDAVDKIDEFLSGLE